MERERYRYKAEREEGRKTDRGGETGLGRVG